MPAPEPPRRPSDVERDWSDWSALAKTCPRCGASVQTLGSRCPVCGKSFTPRGIVDHLPIDSDTAWFDRLLIVLGLWIVAGFVWLAIAKPVAAIVVFGAGFAVLVGLVGLNNWLIERASRGRPRGGGG